MWRAAVPLVHLAKELLFRDGFHGALESPGEGVPVAGTILISGWTFSRRAAVERVEALLDTTLLGPVRYGFERPDVNRAFPWREVPAVGYEATFRLDPEIRGPHSLVVRVVDRRGNVKDYRRRVTIGRASPRRRRPARSAVIERPGEAGDPRLQVADAIVRFELRLECPPSVLDWNSGLDLAARDPRGLVFSPPALTGGRLPYLDRSIDLVIVAGRNPAEVEEARRIAAVAVLAIDGGAVNVIWCKSSTRGSRPDVSIVIPVHGQVGHTEACLRRLQTTLSDDFSVEIVVIDDASEDETPSVLARWKAEDPRIKVLTNPENVGFVESCNRGVREASGEVVVFLNNDTLPEPGWLPPLLASLRDPGVGAVGAKLMYPDGRLQEAGAVVFSDGSGWNFGRGQEEADAPLFNCVRDVDYCSGAALATRRSLFLDLGGFDRRFAPAYYEDTDYAFALRQRGYRVVFQPASVIVHVEGVTSGIDPGAGVKRFQTVNRAKFVEKWKDVLRNQPSPPEQVDRAALFHHSARCPDMVRRALVWSPVWPEYDRESGSRRVYDMLRFLREAGWAVSFVADSTRCGERYATMLQQMGITTYAGKDGPSVGAEYLEDVSELIALGGFDLALFHFWHMADSYLSAVRRYSPATRVIVDSVDLHFLRNARSKYARRARSGGALDGRDADQMMRELNVYAAADAVLTVSAKEADLVNDFVGDRTLAHVIPDAEDLPRSPVAFAERYGILFVGNFNHAPNIEALAFLIRDIVPRLPRSLLAMHPVSVVGHGLTRALIEQCGARIDGVRLVGWVPSLQPYLERTRISVVPLLHGAGTKRKLIQASMVGTPSVSTSIGTEGLPLRDGQHVLVADDPATFASAIVRLLEDSALWERLAARGREAVLETHDREIVRRRFDAMLNRLVPRHLEK